MDVSDVIARREFVPTYIWLDVAFLIGFAALLVWRRKYMTLLVGLVMGGVYFAVGYGAFNLADAFTFDQRRQHVLGAAVDSVSYGFTNFSWLWLWLSRDRHLAEWSILILVWWFCCPLMSQTFTARFASGMQPIVIQRTTGAYHGWMAVILSRRRMVGHAVRRTIGMDTCRSGSGSSKTSETPDVRTYQHQPDAVVQSYNNRSHRLSAMVFEPSRPVDDGLDVVAVRIQHECGIVPRMIGAYRTRCLGRRRRAPRHGNPARPHGSGRGTRYAWAAARARHHPAGTRRSRSAASRHPRRNPTWARGGP